MNTSDTLECMEMSGNPLVDLPRQRKRIEKQIEQLQKQLKKIDKLLADASALQAEFGAADKAYKSGGGSGGALRARVGPRPAEIVATAREILSDAERPLTRGQLLSAMSARGIEIGGANPANKLGTTLSRTDVIKNLPGFGFWLAARPYPPAQHVGKSEGRDPPGELRCDPAIH